MIERRHAGIFRITSDLLREVLKLPEGTIITGVRDDIDYLGSILLRVESPTIDPVPVGNIVPMLSPQFRTTARMVTAFEFAGWNAETSPTRPHTGKPCCICKLPATGDLNGFDSCHSDECNHQITIATIQGKRP